MKPGAVAAIKMAGGQFFHRQLRLYLYQEQIIRLAIFSSVTLVMEKSIADRCSGRQLKDRGHFLVNSPRCFAAIYKRRLLVITLAINQPRERTILLIANVALEHTQSPSN